MTRTLLFVGGSNRKVGWLPAANCPGISTFSIDESTGAFELLGVTAGVENPTFLAIDPAGRHLAAVSEMPAWDEGLVSLYAIGEGGALSYLNKQPTRGDSTAHTSFHPSEPILAVANYSERPAALSVALYRVGETLGAPFAFGRHSGSGPNPQRQTQPHPHCARWSPDGRFLLVPDLGIDRVVIHRVDADRLIHHGEVVLPPGSGPRHIAFHPTLPFAYLVNELASTLATLAWDGEAGTLSVAAIASSVGDWQGTSIASGIAVAPDGCHVVLANRGHSSIACFAIDDTGAAVLKGTTMTDGWIRDLVFSPSGTLVAAANQDRDRIDLYRYDAATGGLTPLAPIPAGTPTAVVFLR